MKSAALALALLLVAAAGCSDASNTQLLPIGSRCSSNGQCGTAPYDCAIAAHPYGYCEKPCTTSGDCPADSLCSVAAHACRRVCMNSSSCRVADGYSCQTLVGDQGSVCEASGSTSMDAGAP